MKTTKLLALLLAALMLLALPSCSDGTDTVNVYYMTGTTGFGMAKLISDYAENESFVFTSMQTNAVAVRDALIAGEVDIATLPTNAAAAAYNLTNGEIQILAINTLGCLYLINNTGTKITSLSELDGKTVYVPSQNPTAIFKHICEANDLNVDIVSGMDASAISAAIASPVKEGDVKIDYAVLPEPVATATVTKAGAAGITLTNDLDLTAEWNKIEPVNSLVQGCLVARREFIEENPELIADFLADYKASIEYLNHNVADAAQLLVNLGIFEGKAPIIQKAIPSCNVNYVDGEAMKSAMQTYLGVLLQVAPASIGNALPTDGFYYLGK